MIFFSKTNFIGHLYIICLFKILSMSLTDEYIYENHWHNKCTKHLHHPPNIPHSLSCPHLFFCLWFQVIIGLFFSHYGSICIAVSSGQGSSSLFDYFILLNKMFQAHVLLSLLHPQISYLFRQRWFLLEKYSSKAVRSE